MLLTVCVFEPDPRGETPDFWTAGIKELDGVYGYGLTRDRAERSAQAEALRLIASEVETGERPPLGFFQSIMFINEDLGAPEDPQPEDT